MTWHLMIQFGGYDSNIWKIIGSFTAISFGEWMDEEQ